MTRIFTSKWHGDDKCVERIHVVEFNSDEDHWQFTNFNNRQRLESLDIPIKEHIYEFYDHSRYHVTIYERKYRKEA